MCKGLFFRRNNVRTCGRSMRGNDRFMCLIEAIITVILHMHSNVNVDDT